jgi:hypothetical protein
MTNGSQQIPNGIDPFQSLFQMAMPALGSMKTGFDLINCFMALVDVMIAVMEVMGILLLTTGNPALNQIFPLKTIKNTDTDTPIPGFAKDEDTGAPDLGRLIDAMIKMLACVLKLAGLVPQLSFAATIKDGAMGIIGILEAVMAQINGITDKLSLIPPPTTGDATLDFELSCANDSIQIEIEHQMGPLSQLVPMMALFDIMMKPLKQGLPAPVATIIRTCVGLGLIPLADGSAKENFLDLIDTMEAEGLPIELPDFNDLSDIPAKIDELKAVLGPDLLNFIEQVQEMLDKIMEIE